MDNLPSIHDLTLAITRLTILDESELATLIEKDRDAYARLLEAMGGFISVSCGNLNKLYEKVVALDLQTMYDKNKAEVAHMISSCGADIHITDYESGTVMGIEVKCSTTKQSTKYRTNWMFKANPALLAKYVTEESNEARKCIERDVILDFYRKMRGGKAILVAQAKTRQLNRYELDGLFMALVCAKIALDSISGVVNLGSERCMLCDEYHRIQHLQRMHDIYMTEALKTHPTLAKEPFIACFTPEEWTIILKTIAAHKDCDEHH